MKVCDDPNSDEVDTVCCRDPNYQVLCIVCNQDKTGFIVYIVQSSRPDYDYDYNDDEVILEEEKFNQIRKNENRKVQNDNIKFGKMIGNKILK